MVDLEFLDFKSLSPQLPIDFIGIEESNTEMILTDKVSGIMGLAPIGNNNLEKASIMYDLKDKNKVDNLIFSINMGKVLGGPNIKLGGWDITALKKSK